MQGLLIVRRGHQPRRLDRAGQDPGRAARPPTSRPTQVVTGYNGVKFDEKGQNVLASSLITQMQGGKYVPVWPKDKAAGELKLPYKGW